MLTFQDALNTILNNLTPTAPRRLQLEECLGLTLAEDIFAAEDIPCFDNSAMDGYAVRSADVTTATAESPVSLRALERVPAGRSPSHEVSQGTAIKVMTGGMIPVGADAVVPVEMVEESGSAILVKRSARFGENIRPAGEDLKKGEPALSAGTVLNSYKLALLAAVGAANPLVYPAPRVGLLATGSELIPIASALEPGKVRDSASVAIAARLREIGAVPVRGEAVADVQSEVESRLASLAETVDVIVTIGAVSMGDYDYVRPAVDKLGQIIFWKVAIRPGSPFLFGRIRGKPLFGLPGNPASAMITFETLARPALMKMMGKASTPGRLVRAISEAAIKDREGRTSFVRGIYVSDSGAARVKPVGPQGSGLHKPMAEANCLIVIPENTAEIAEGDEVEALCFES
ncbi:MAG: molybdopterin molybdotransferase MoeA [Armatimonadota bacterium]|nr:molybdopterin molybdotransferase MoeA [Armatimonadota bacterium]